VKPLVHSQISVKRYGGVVEDYIPIHDFFDSSKAAFADVRHRAILHNSFGIYLAERIFGTYITNAEGKKVSVRDIAEDHVSEDMGGRIPSVQDWLQHLEIQPWMKNLPSERIKKTRSISLDETHNID
jgi:hypothetical protein